MRHFLTIVPALLAPTLAAAQLSPDRLYYGVGRAIPMTVKVPANLKEGMAQVRLYSVAGEDRGTAPVVAGAIDLAALLPVIWKREAVTSADVLYAQLLVGERGIGPAVVLQPLVEPPYCVYLEQETGEPKYRESRGFLTGVRAYVDQFVSLKTSMGEVVLAMRPDHAPNTVWNFMELARGGFYTDVIFHRVKALHPNGSPFVIQAGDPSQSASSTTAADGGPGYFINLEPSKLPHDFGVISMARNRMPNSAGSQFFICLSRDGTSFLDGQYTSFGQAVAGADVIQKLAAVEVSGDFDRPKNPPAILSALLVDAPPFNERPKPVAAPAK
ncbi:MAG: peptidylprolyl isomerase [Phycisphaerales bacterium]